MNIKALVDKQKVIVTCFILISQAVISQRMDIDSLRRAVNSYPDNMAKAAQMIHLSRNYLMLQQLDSALFYSELAKDLSLKLNYMEGEADALYLKSLIFKIRQDYDASLDLADQYIALYERLGDTLRLAKGYYNLAVTLKESGDNDLALIYSKKSIAYSLPIHDSVLLLGNYNCLGSIYSDVKSKGDSAAFYYLKALEISEKKGNKFHMATILNNLGMIFFSEKDYDVARKYILRSLEINEQLNATGQMALNYNNLGRITAGEEDFAGALEYYSESLKLYEQLSALKGISDVNTNIGDLFFRQKKYREALEKFDLAFSGYRELGLEERMVSAMMNKSAAYSEMGKIDLAISMQDSCLRISDSIGNYRLKLLVLQNIADNYQKQGHFMKAYETMLDRIALSGDIYDIEKSKVIHDLLLKYEKEQDQSRILSLEKENLRKTSQRNGYLFGGLAIIILAGFIILYFRQKAKHEKVVARQKILQLEEEKKLMAARLLVEGQEEERKRIATELHDGLGVLLSATKMQFSTIVDKSPENKELIERATKMLEQASGDVRKISHNMMPGLLTKLGFYEAAEDLFERIGDAGEIRALCTINGETERLPENKEIMLYRIVQELVNNTLKHADAKTMSLLINILPGKLEMTYNDDGKGFIYEKAITSGSLGLKSIQSRVDFMNGELSVDSHPGSGTKFHFLIPV